MLRSLIQSFITAAIERMAAATIGGVVAQSTAESAIQEADCLDRLEEAARAYESAGKPQLAARLRERATAVTADTPGTIQALPNQSHPTMLTDGTAEENGEPTAPSPAKRRRRRSATSQRAEQ